MRYATCVCLVAIVLLGCAPGAWAQASAGPAGGQQPAEKKDDPPAPSQIDQLSKQVEELRAALDNQDPDFALVLGLGSLIVGPNVTDYKNESNVIRAVNLGRAVPQLLTGVSFRTNVPSPFRRFRGRE